MFTAALYKATRPGIPGIYNRGVRIITQGPYSHCEAVFSDGVSWSASFADGGVRQKVIEYDPAKWDFITLPDCLEADSRDWFERHEGMKYDIWGNVRFVIPIVPHSPGRRFCSEAFAESLGVPDPWRYCPNGLASMLQALSNLHNCIRESGLWVPS